MGGFDETDAAEHAAERADYGRPPIWWHEGPRPCTCQVPGQLLRSFPARSDGSYVELKCSNCGSRWFAFNEG